MEIVAEDVEVAGAHGPLLRPTSLRMESGRTQLVPGTPGPGLTALALVLSGRLRPSGGRVHVDGTDNPRNLRRTVTVVDAPEVTSPEGSVRVRDVVAEGLSLAGHRSGGRAVRGWIRRHDLENQARERFENLAPLTRTRLLVDLAIESAHVQALVLDSPDRHGGDPSGWYALAQREADRGFAVAVLCEPYALQALSPTETDAQLSTTDSTPGGAR